MAEAALQIKDLRAAYGDIEVVHGVDLEILPGSVFALLGPNGGGKSTLLKVIAGLMQPTAGQIHIKGEKTADADMASPPENLAKSGLCLIPEGKGIFPNLTVKENLRIQTLLDKDINEIEEITFRHFPQLADKSKQLAGTLSGGEQQMLSLSRALSTSPSLLLLDELSMGLAPFIISELYEIVAQVAADGVSILVVEQSAASVTRIANKAAIMSCGTILKSGNPKDIEAELAEAYLGI